jgi:hypothetical protein
VKLYSSISLFLFIICASVPTVQGNPLAGLPSQPGSTVDLINALGDNQWLELDSVAPDPVWGRARGRSWGGDGMVYIPELRGAIMTGEGRHAYVKPDGFGQDDYWFYDINAHKWICLYPGTDTQNFNQLVANGDIKVDPTNGHVVDSLGDLMPGHLLIHAWGYLAYDSDNKRFAFAVSGSGTGYGSYYMPGGATVQQGLDALDAQGKGSFGANFSPWYYNIQTGKFERFASNAVPSYECCRAFGQFEYSPLLKKFLYASTRGISTFDPVQNTWGVINATGTNPSSSEWGGCYDSKRDKVYAGQNPNDFYSYDVQTQTWTKLSSQGPGSITFDTNDGGVEYDSFNDMVIITDFRNDLLCPYNPATDTWESAVNIPTAITGTIGTFYDPGLGVHFFFAAGDSRDDGEMWVYRYKGNPYTIQQNSTAVAGSGPKLSVLPNPFNATTVIKVLRGQGAEDLGQSAYISILNIAGKKVFDLTSDLWHLSSGITWNPASLPAGIYFLRVQAGSARYIKRIFLER